MSSLTYFDDYYYPFISGLVTEFPLLEGPGVECSICVADERLSGTDEN